MTVAAIVLLTLLLPVAFVAGYNFRRWREELLLRGERAGRRRPQQLPSNVIPFKGPDGPQRAHITR